VLELRALAKQNTPTRVINLKLSRLPAAIRSKAHRRTDITPPSSGAVVGQMRRLVGSSARTYVVAVGISEAAHPLARFEQYLTCVLYIEETF
jgi:hypothetical protein